MTGTAGGQPRRRRPWLLDGTATTGQPIGMTASVMDPVEERELQRVVDAIVRLVDPTELMLFGSFARGEATPSSDFDLLVVIPDGTPGLATTKAIYRALGDVHERTRGVDVVVLTEGEFERGRHDIATVARWAAREGRSIHRRAVPHGA